MFSPCHVTILLMVSFAVLKFLIRQIYWYFPLWFFWPFFFFLNYFLILKLEKYSTMFFLTYILRVTLNLSGVYSSKWYLDMKIHYKYINSYFTQHNLTNCPFSQFKCHFYYKLSCYLHLALCLVIG